MNLPLNIDLVQILLHMLNLVILVGGLTLILYRPLVKFLENRRKTLADQAQKNAEDAEANEKLRAEYEEKMRTAKEQIEEQRLTAEQETAEKAVQYIDEAKARADNILRAAEEEAEQRREHILDAAQTEIQELVLSATQKLLADTVSPERDSALYDRFIRMTEEETAAAGRRADKADAAAAAGLTSDSAAETASADASEPSEASKSAAEEEENRE